MKWLKLIITENKQVKNLDSLNYLNLNLNIYHNKWFKNKLVI